MGGKEERLLQGVDEGEESDKGLSEILPIMNYYLTHYSRSVIDSILRRILSWDHRSISLLLLCVKTETLQHSL